MTPTEICNLALDILKEAPIASFEENRSIAQWCKRNFTVRRNALLERWEWNFALRRVLLARDTSCPAFGWSYSYTLPADCLRMIPLTHDGSYEGRPVAHEIEAGKLFTDAPGPLPIRYIAATDDYGRYPASFIEALAARLAVHMAHWLTGKSNFVQIADGLYRDAINSAWAIDAISGTAPRAEDREWTDLR